MAKFVAPALGWQRDLPDSRDLLPETPAVRDLLRPLKRSSSARAGRPAKVDLRKYFTEVDDQQRLNASTVHACLALVAYFERRAHGRKIEPSRLFLYRVARKLLGVQGDCGVNLRAALRAMVSFGVPPERYWPYDVERLDEEPEAFHYSFLSAYCSIRYVRLDARNATGSQTLEIVKGFLAAGFPAAFGFSVPNSISIDSEIPYRPAFDDVCGGQAVVAVGYDDRWIRSTKGALLVRNSWGHRWGKNGYGWLPYAYVESQLAGDFWTLLKPDWLDSGEFKRPRFAR